MANELVAIEGQLKQLTPRFAEVLGDTMRPERLIRTICVSVERLPKLAECTRQSLFNSAMSAAVLGLEVDGVTGQAYLIPFKGQAQLVIGYKGYNTLAARSGITITGAVVREGDEFEYELGTGAFVRHRPKAAPNKDRRIVAAWACAQSLSRPAVIAVMNIDELNAVKAKSPGASRSDSPWNDPAIGFPAMCEKTVKRRLARSLPMNVMQLAARMDEAVDEQGAPAWISPDKGVVVDGEFTPLPHRNTETPTAEDLTSPISPAKAAPASSTATSDDAKHGAASIPTAKEYAEKWRSICDSATNAEQLDKAWRDDVETRNAVKWPSDVAREEVRSHVSKAINFLKGAA
jgi:recombination protein RecT